MWPQARCSATKPQSLLLAQNVKLVVTEFMFCLFVLVPHKYGSANLPVNARQHGVHKDKSHIISSWSGESAFPV